jgi:hypothetical protein
LRAPIGLGFWLLCLSAHLCFPQVLDRAELTGTIRDDTGGRLPGVTVTLTQTETGLTRVLTTDASGSYRAPLLPVGPYRIQAELDGFADFTREGVILTVGSAPVIDIALPLATVTEALTVMAERPIVETTGVFASAPVNQKAIATLPLNGRDFRDFALLTPRVEVNPGTFSTLRIGGQPGYASLFTVDGADMTNSFFGEYTGSIETSNFTISQEAVQEFQVSTNGFSAEFGRSAGGLLNVVTKSGTNHWRGSAFLFLRDDALTADDPFGNPPDSFSQQQFGGSVGGPVARDKAFFFFAVDLQNKDIPIFTQFNRSVDGVAVPELGIDNLGDFERQTTRREDFKAIFGRVDLHLSPAHRVTVRTNFSDNDGRNYSPATVTNVSPDGFEDYTNEALSVVTSLTSVIGTRAFNELKYHFVRETRPRDLKSERISFGIAGTGSFGGSGMLPVNSTHLRHQLTDSFSYLLGSHDLKFGADWNSTVLNDNFFAPLQRGTYSFPSLEAFEARQPLFFTQWIFYEPFGPDNFEIDGYWQHELGLFIQDKWQAASNLTVNFGLRYEAQWNDDPKFPIAAPDGTVPMSRQAPGTELRPVPQTVPDDLNNFGPRLGLSWDPTKDGRTVVRGGAGLYYARTPAWFLPTGGSGFRSSFVYLSPLFPPWYILPFPELLPSVIDPNNPPPLPINPPGIDFVADDYNNPRVLNVNAGAERELAPHLSLGIDFIYSRSDNARIGGLGTSGGMFNQNTFPPTGVDEFGRPIGIDVLQRGGPDPRFHAITMLSSLGRARYKAVTVSLNKRFSHRHQFFAHYTWSRDESNGQTELGAGRELGPTNPFDVDADFGINERDITHRFVASGTAELGLGLTVSGIAVLRSGRSMPAFTKEDVNGDMAFFDRPVDENGNLVPRYPARHPNFYNVDLRVMWSGQLGNAGTLDILFEVFNLFNHSNKESNVFDYDVPNYGALDTFAGTPRTAQIGIKYRFGMN